MTQTHDPLRGFDLLVHPATNRSTAFTQQERDTLGLHGLLPAQVSSMQSQQTRVLEGLRRKAYDIERYIALQALQDRNERLFYRTLVDNLEELMPIVYTPTVGQACKEFAHIFRRPRGFYVTPDDLGQIRQNLENWPEAEVKVVVMTDAWWASTRREAMVNRRRLSRTRSSRSSGRGGVAEGFGGNTG